MKDREALYFTIIQIAGLYNKIHGTYLSHDNEKVFFKMISAQDKNKIFNEGNEYFIIIIFQNHLMRYLPT